MGRLMADFRSNDPEKMNFTVLADCVREAKSQQKGATKMSKVMQEMEQIGYGRGTEDAQCDAVQKLMEKLGYSLEQAMSTLDIVPSKKENFEARLREV